MWDFTALVYVSPSKISSQYKLLIRKGFVSVTACVPDRNLLVPVFQGFRPPPPVILPPPPPQGPNPYGSRPPCAPPFRDLALPPPNVTVHRIFLYLDLATKKASEIWFGNLFDNGFARFRLRANVVWYFQKVGVDFLVIIYVIIVLQLRAWFFCVFFILPILSIVSWVIPVSD